MMVVIALMGLGSPVFDEAFMADRRKMAPDIDFDRVSAIVPAKLLQLRANLDLLERQLAHEAPFLLGEHPSLADLAAFHPLIGLMVHPELRALLDPLEHVPAWMQRVQALGHGKREELDSAAAIAIARDATPAEPESDGTPLPDGLEVGQPVAVLPEEIGSGVATGELLPSPVHEIAIRRQSERAGELVVHFPREDYLVVPAGS